MEKNINLSTATDKEREAYLLDHWHIESLSFVAEFHYDEVKQIGIIDNVYSSNGKRILKYPIIKDRPVRFKISKKQQVLGVVLIVLLRLKKSGKPPTILLLYL